MNKRTNHIAIVCAVAASLAACGKTDTASTDTTERVERVQTQKLELTEISRDIEYSTVLEGYDTQNVAPSLTGIIEHIYVEVGDRVKQGDMLVRMDQNQYKTTKLTFANLQIEMQRVEALRESGSISEQTYDQTKLSYDQTKESLDFLEVNTYVKAPFKGVISAKSYEDGELYSGQPIVVLTQLDQLKALVSIPETYFPLVKKGMPLTLQTDIYPDETFPASIEIVYPTIDPTTHTFQIKLQIPNASERLRPGMYVRTTLSLGQVETIIVPYQAVLKLQGANDRYVFINNNGVAKRVPVKLGQRFDDQIEIISDEIHAGDELVTGGQARLVGGVKLQVVQGSTTTPYQAGN